MGCLAPASLGGGGCPHCPCRNRSTQGPVSPALLPWTKAVCRPHCPFPAPTRCALWRRNPSTIRSTRTSTRTCSDSRMPRPIIAPPLGPPRAPTPSGQSRTTSLRCRLVTRIRTCATGQPAPSLQARCAPSLRVGRPRIRFSGRAALRDVARRGRWQQRGGSGWGGVPFGARTHPGERPGQRRGGFGDERARECGRNLEPDAQPVVPRPRRHVVLSRREPDPTSGPGTRQGFPAVPAAACAQWVVSNGTDTEYVLFSFSLFFPPSPPIPLLTSRPGNS
jgi:hypothetical protein